MLSGNGQKRFRYGEDTIDYVFCEAGQTLMDIPASTPVALVFRR